jgi:hypothetical protein
VLAVELPASRDFPTDRPPLAMEPHWDVDSLTRKPTADGGELDAAAAPECPLSVDERILVRTRPKSGFDPMATFWKPVALLEASGLGANQLTTPSAEHFNK